MQIQGKKALPHRSEQRPKSHHKKLHLHKPKVIEVLQCLYSEEQAEKLFDQCFPKQPITVNLTPFVPNPEILQFATTKTKLLAAYELDLADVATLFNDPDEETIILYFTLRQIHESLENGPVQEITPPPDIIVQDIQLFHFFDLFYDVIQNVYMETGRKLQESVLSPNSVMGAFIPIRGSKRLNKLKTFPRTRNEISAIDQAANLLESVGNPHDYQRLYAMVTGFLDYGNSQPIREGGYLIFTLKCLFHESHPSTHGESVATKDPWQEEFSADLLCNFDPVRTGLNLDHTNTWMQLFHLLARDVDEGSVLMQFGARRDELYVHTVTHHERDEFLPGAESGGLEATVTELMTRRWPFQISFYIWKVNGIMRMYLGYAGHRFRIRARADVHSLLWRLARMVVIPFTPTTSAIMKKLSPVFSAYPFESDGRAFVRLVYLNEEFRDNVRTAFQGRGIGARNGLMSDFQQMHPVLMEDFCLPDDAYDSLKRDINEIDGLFESSAMEMMEGYVTPQ